jgi:hypothetical protein
MFDPATHSETNTWWPVDFCALAGNPGQVVNVNAGTRTCQTLGADCKPTGPTGGARDRNDRRRPQFRP